jgi:hypothetical protein
MTYERVYAELLLRWSRTVEEHGLSWAAWLTTFA